MRALLVPLALAGFCQLAWAGDISSVYTDLDWKNDCETYAQSEQGDGDWASLACAGYRGYPVLIGYDDARESVFYGFPCDDMTAVWESFSGWRSRRSMKDAPSAWCSPPATPKPTIRRASYRRRKGERFCLRQG